MKRIFYMGIILVFCNTGFSPTEKKNKLHKDQVRFQYAMIEKGDSLYAGIYNVLYYFTDSSANRKGVYNLVCLADFATHQYKFRGVSKSYHNDSLPANFPEKVVFNSEYTWKFQESITLSIKANPDEKSRVKIKATGFRNSPPEKTVFKNFLEVGQYEKTKLKIKLNGKSHKTHAMLNELTFTNAHRFLYEEHRKVILSFTANDLFFQVNAYMNSTGELESNLGGYYKWTSDKYKSTNGVLYIQPTENVDLKDVGSIFRSSWNVADLEKKTDLIIKVLPLKQLVTFYKKSFWLGFARVTGKINGESFKGYASVIMN